MLLPRMWQLNVVQGGCEDVCDMNGGDQSNRVGPPLISNRIPFPGSPSQLMYDGSPEKYASVIKVQRYMKTLGIYLAKIGKVSRLAVQVPIVGSNHGEASTGYQVEYHQLNRDWHASPITGIPFPYNDKIPPSHRDIFPLGYRYMNIPLLSWLGYFWIHSMELFYHFRCSTNHHRSFP